MKYSSIKTQLRFAYLSLLPIFLLFTVLRIWPILQAFYLSLTNYQLAKRRFSFLGLQNFINLFTKDKDFILSLKNTLLFAFLTAVFLLLLSFIVALIMDRRRIFGIGLLQSMYFLPVVISVVPCAIIWKWIYDPQYGILNQILKVFGLKGIGWLVDSRFSIYSVIVFVVWKWLGYYMVIFWVGLKAIPDQYIEAARIDGAGQLKIVRLIILPLLRPIILLATVFTTVRGFTLFSEVYVMTVGSQGAPGNMVKVLTYDIYERSFVFFKVGEANAEAIILFLLLLGFSIAQIAINRRGRQV